MFQVGGMYKYKYDFITNLPLSNSERILKTGVNIWWCYGQKYSVLFFFWLTVYIVLFIGPTFLLQHQKTTMVAQNEWLASALAHIFTETRLITKSLNTNCNTCIHLFTVA